MGEDPTLIPFFGSSSGCAILLSANAEAFLNLPLFRLGNRCLRESFAMRLSQLDAQILRSRSDRPSKWSRLHRYLELPRSKVPPTSS